MIQKISIKELEQKSKEQEFVKFNRGSRKLIHPSFESIDNIDCEFIYNKHKRFFYVEYSPVINNNIKNYTRSIISSNVEHIIKEIKKYQETPLV
jgi:hypothetical protein